jgi:hypothetical protein
MFVNKLGTHARCRLLSAERCARTRKPIRRLPQMLALAVLFVPALALAGPAEDMSAVIDRSSA